MNAFDALFVLACVAMVATLFRVRPALLILAVNQAITTRALANISRYGQPHSQGFVPSFVFNIGNLQIAAGVFTISIGLTLAFSLLPARQYTVDPRTLPRLPRPLMWLLVAYFVALAASQRTILTATYTDPNRLVFGANLGGGTAFLNSIFIYEIVRRCWTAELKRSFGIASILAVFIATDYLHGSTGLATGFVVTSAMLILSRGAVWRRTGTIAGLLGGLALLALTVRVIRLTVSTGEGGLSSVAALFSDSNEERNGEGIESAGNGSQYAAHVLECITLQQSGEGREWRSVYLPIVYTFEPSFLIYRLGIERPKEAAYELMDYFIGGGGIFVVGELYWNGGYLCVLLVFCFIAFVCWKADVTYSNGFVGLMMACHVGSNLLQGTGYGFAQVSRGMINGLLAVAIWAVVRNFTGAKAAATTIPSLGRAVPGGSHD